MVAFQIMISIDESQPAGTRSAFSVTEVDAATKDAAVQAISRAADDLDRNIFKVQPDPQQSTQGRVLFAFIGDGEAFESHGGSTYPAFSARTTTTIVAASDITTEDLRGRYVTDATGGQLTQILTELDAAGILAQDDTVGVPGLLVYSVAQGNLAPPFVIMVFLLGLAISYSVARNRKVHALRALHGYRRTSILGSEIGSATATFAVGLVGLLVVGLPVLAVYNGLRQGPRFLGVVGVTMLVLYLAVVTLVATAVWSLPRTKIPLVLKGEQVPVRNGVLAAVAQIAVLAIVLATTSAAMDRIEAIQQNLQASDQWADGDPLYALRLGVSGTREDDLRAAPALGTVVTELEDAGQVLLVSNTAQAGAGADTSVEPEGGNSLLVNNAYLSRQVVRADDGRRITDLPTGKDQFTLLVPRSYDGDPQQLLQRYADYFRDFSCTVGRAEGDTVTCDPQGTVVRTAPGQHLFIYNGTSFLPAELQPPDTLCDPVVAVVAAQSELLAPLQYLSWSSQDDVLFSDPAALDDGLQQQGIAGAFQGVDNAADAVATARALSERELQMDAFSLPLGWAALVLASIVMAMVYCDRRKRPMFVELIHGYSFTARHRTYLAAGLLLSLLGVGAAGIGGQSFTSGRDLLAATAFVAVQFAISLTAVRIYETRIRADFIKRY